jgi:hypothetical protein
MTPRGVARTVHARLRLSGQRLWCRLAHGGDICKIVRFVHTPQGDRWTYTRCRKCGTEHSYTRWQP